MKRYMCCWVLAICLMTVFTAPCYSQDTYKAEETTMPVPTGERAMWDTLVMQPAGLVACLLGLGVSIVALPFAMFTKSEEPMFKALVAEPFSYTFARPVGQIDPPSPDISQVNPLPAR